ncbi:MAG: ATP-binding cassette domain-containing protein [Acutalibacteraceae bacterium]|jgi:ABC-2 type transport system ATP-binding protein
MEVIKTTNLTKFYGKSRGIIDLNMTVSEGDFYGFIGPNGAGKSTTIRTLLGFITPTGGSAEIFGMDIIDNRKEILSITGYLPSEAIFYPGMRVRDILKLSADLHKTDCTKESKILCDRLLLDTSRRVEELSFGNRKKVAIVCALQHRPKLLVLDEPTSGLDPLMQHEFYNILHERNKEGATIFLSSHVLSEIQHNCTKTAIIREGRIIVDGSVENLSKTNAKRVNIRGNFDPKGLDGLRDINVSDNGVNFLYSGDINELIKRLSQTNITDLTVAEPELEEIFMHYYTNGGNKE